MKKVKIHPCILKSTPVFSKYTPVLWKYTHVFSKYTPVFFENTPLYFSEYTPVFFWISKCNPIFSNTPLHFKIQGCILGKIHTLVLSRNYSNCSKYTHVFYTFLKNTGMYFKIHPCIFENTPLYFAKCALFAATFSKQNYNHIPVLRRGNCSSSIIRLEGYDL